MTWEPLHIFFQTKNHDIILLVYWKYEFIYNFYGLKFSFLCFNIFHLYYFYVDDKLKWHDI